jgi:hypothetical protein
MANTRRRALIFCFIGREIYAGRVLMGDGAHSENVLGRFKVPRVIFGNARRTDH